jgi:hypothetical protein
MKKAIYADVVAGCQDIDISDAYDYPVMISDDADDVINDLAHLTVPTVYIVTPEVYDAVDDWFGIH